MKPERFIEELCKLKEQAAANSEVQASMPAHKEWTAKVTAQVALADARGHAKSFNHS
jgi:hypothetical protein